MTASFAKKLLQIFISLNFISFHVANAQAEVKSSSSIDGEGSMLFKYAMDQNVGIMMHVKFAVLLDAKKKPTKLIFQNTNTYPFHSDFLTTTEKFSGLTRPQIDELTLKDTPSRKAILGTLFTHTAALDPDLSFQHSFELVTNDVVPAAIVNLIQQMLLKSSPGTLAAKSFAYLATGPNKQAILSQSADLKAAGIKVVDLFKNKNYQSYVQGWSVGKVKIARAADLEVVLKTGVITAETILITDQVPREIPPIRGLISTEPTAMSSHVVLLAEMFQIPFAADKNILEKAQALDGKYVYVRVGESSISRLTPINEATYRKLAQIKASKPLDIAVDFTKTKILPTIQLKDSDISAYGGKSVRLGLLKRKIPANAPEYSVAIPVSYFKKYLETAVTASGAPLKDVIDDHLKAIEAGHLNYAEITARLSQIRNIMKETEIPKALAQEIYQQISKLIPSTVTRAKLRSSSNVEDGSEFNGAGLYDSDGVWLNGAPADKPDSFAKGLNKVWRSFYSDRGFLARQSFKVDESKAAMGILVQETFKDELANGVALWLPPQSEWEQTSAKVIGFPGEESSVTNPTGADQPEIMRLGSQKDDSVNPPRITWSTNLEQRTTGLPLGQTIMDENFYIEVAQLMEKVAQSWPGGAPKSGLDFEWKLIVKNQTKQILLKQVRPLVKVGKEKLPNGAKIFIVGGFEEALDIGYNEDVDAYGQHFCPVNLKVKMPSFSDQDFAAPLIIPSIKLSLRGKSYEFKNVKAEGKLIEEQGQSNLDLQFTIDTDDYKGIRFNFTGPGYGGTEGVIDSYNMKVQGSAKDLALAKSFYTTVEDYACGYSSPYDFGSFDRHLDPKNTIQKLDAEIKLIDGSVIVHGQYELVTGFDKTFHYILSSTIVKGFGLKNDSKILAPQSATYAGGHHNFMWGVSIDMAGSDLTEPNKEEFYKKYGRYLMIKSGILGGPGGKGETQAVWMKPDGTLGKPFKAAWKSLK